jgi:hypothetical protein
VTAAARRGSRTGAWCPSRAQPRCHRQGEVGGRAGHRQAAARLAARELAAGGDRVGPHRPAHPALVAGGDADVRLLAGGRAGQGDSAMGWTPEEDLPKVARGWWPICAPGSAGPCSGSGAAAGPAPSSTPIGTARPSRSPARGPRVLSQVLDVTRPGEALQALNESERRFRTMADGAPVNSGSPTPPGGRVFVTAASRSTSGSRRRSRGPPLARPGAPRGPGAAPARPGAAPSASAPRSASRSGCAGRTATGGG